MQFLTHLQSAVIVLLLLIIYIQHDIINKQTKSSANIALWSSPSLPVVFSDRQTQGSSSSRALVGGDNYGGVAVTLFLGSPKWFQDRYSMMVNQVIASIPSDWIVQIFFDPSAAMAVKGTQYAGIQKQVNSGRVVLTELPANMTRIKKRDLLKSTWLWENMLAETVLLFGGNGALCANSPFDVHSFSRFDYIGAPWKTAKGNGGSGDISMRKKSVVLQALREVKRTGRESEIREDSVLVKFLFKQKGSMLANQTDTLNFAMTNAVAIGSPFAGVGVLSSFNDEDRRKYLDYCPEMKMLFPSLHNPSCFGAETVPGLCFKSLCLSGGLDCHKGNDTFMFARTYYIAEGTHFASVGTLSSFNDETHGQYLGYCPEISSRCTSDSVLDIDFLLQILCARMAEWTATARTSALRLIIFKETNDPSKQSDPSSSS